MKAFRGPEDPWGPNSAEVCTYLVQGFNVPSVSGRKMASLTCLTMKMNGYEWYVLRFMRGDPQELLISDKGIVDIDGASCSQTPCLKRGDGTLEDPDSFNIRW